MAEVLCIGNASYDISVFVSGFPLEDSKTETRELLEAGGGPAANAAYLLSSWGVSCAFAGLLGNDRYAMRILEEFRAVGTDVSLVQVRRNHVTPLSVILVNIRNGTRTLVNRKCDSAKLKLRKASLQRRRPILLFFDGHELEASLAALRAFPKAVSILDAGSWREGTAVLAPKVNYLVASEKFALQTSKLARLQSQRERRLCMKRLRERFGHTTVVTLGARGLMADEGGGYLEMSAFRAKPVDTTAAGDVFHGAFAYGVTRQMSFLETLRLASIAASISVQKKGGRPSIPTLAGVKTALAHAQ